MKIDHTCRAGRIVGTIATDNAAFHDENGKADREARSAELGRLTARAMRQASDGATSGTFRDYNGNTVGSWGLVR